MEVQLKTKSICSLVLGGGALAVIPAMTMTITTKTGTFIRETSAIASLVAGSAGTTGSRVVARTEPRLRVTGTFLDIIGQSSEPYSIRLVDLQGRKVAEFVGILGPEGISTHRLAGGRTRSCIALGTIGDKKFSSKLVVGGGS
ncbi:MAG: hypothetical protein RL318_1803 [Fibrobacterota bacterium]